MNLEQLVNEGYTILNGEVLSTSIKPVNSKIKFSLVIRGDGWGCNYGDFNLFEEWFNGEEALLNIASTLDIEDISEELTGKNIRIAVKNVQEPVKYIGNIVYDKWFNYDDYRINKIEESNIEEVDTKVVEEESD